MRIAILAVAAVLVATPAAATDQADALASAKQFIDGFNKGDTTTALAACASPVSIVDDFPPYAWQGTTACADWAAAYDAAARQEGITEPVVTLQKPRHLEVTGDRGYVVFPAVYTYKLKGKKVKESGSTFTVALQKTPAGWRITGWAWAKG
jgi:hypothetical protein